MRWHTYIDNFSIGVIDKPVKDDSHTFIAPDPYKLFHSIEPVWSSKNHTIVDPRQIAKIKDVVKLWRGRWQITDNWTVYNWNNNQTVDIALCTVNKIMGKIISSYQCLSYCH